jgi:uncharacterized protein (UPF0262 family)
MLSEQDRATARINAAICTSEADDLETLADQIQLWQGQLIDMYRLGLTNAAAGLLDDLGNLAGKLQHDADTLREEAQG